MSINIAILDDHQSVIDELKLLLKDRPGLNIVAENTSGLMLLHELKRKRVDILLTDVVMPEIDGFEMSLRMKSDFPKIKLIALSAQGDGPIIERMIEEANVSGFLRKNTTKQELLDAIEAVAEDDIYYSKEIIEELQAYMKLKNTNQSTKLTGKEIKIIQYVASELSNVEIAKQCSISERTLEIHLKKIFRKLNTDSMDGLFEIAKKMKWN